MDPRPVAYVVGNHMHWVDMEWLWGYHVLPGSVRDMLDLCREAGVKACVNFDAVGYERLAVEAPEALEALRSAVQAGIVEPVGCSYGQPYGLFHGGESNVRQRVFGVRSTMRLLGVRPRTFWEEEFDFFPQLPQILAGCGFTGASLFFQWTWHTPEVPIEETPVVLWEGIDGTRLPTATRNRLNLHQWPEDMDHVLGTFAASPEDFGDRPLILQWLELMPSPDWMCRSELILPKLKELIADPRFEVQPMTLGEYLAGAGDALPVRAYAMSDVWHGLSLGKGGDRMRRESAETEALLLATESRAASLSLFGRPYATWDVVPVWELEEAWRELLIAQHHDIDECEGLCGRIGRAHYANAQTRAIELGEALDARLATLLECADHEVPESWGSIVLRVDPISDASAFKVDDEGRVTLAGLDEPFCELGWTEQQVLRRPRDVGRIEVVREEDRTSCFLLEHHPLSWFVRASQGGVSLDVVSELPLEPGFGGALVARFRLPGGIERLWADTPYSVSQVEATSRGRRKYPEGDWMTSPQWFEEVEGAFTGLSFVDLEVAQPDGSWAGVMVLLDGTRQWFRNDDGSVHCVLDLYDPWDERHDLPVQPALAFLPHGPLSPADRVRLALAHRAGVLAEEPEGHPLRSFMPLVCRNPHVVPTALYRELESFAGRGLDRYAGAGLGYPFVARLVEFDGVETVAEVFVAGPVAKAFKTNLLGEVLEVLAPEEGPEDGLGVSPAALEPYGIVPQTLRVPMRPHEIATLVLDLVPGRKQIRDLDAKRDVWATVHR
ncbi:MAG TPA: hypothetical protein PLH94_00005 [Fimbriimonadaceae bacterium]|nr:hypothetical protein [Fimbriimonadaceae bacterium]